MGDPVYPRLGRQRSVSTEETAVTGYVPTEKGTVKGAQILPVYAQREMTSYAVTDHELDTLALANTGVVFSWSLATFLLGVAVSIWIGVSIAASDTETTRLLARVIAPVLAVLAIAF